MYATPSKQKHIPLQVYGYGVSYHHRAVSGFSDSQGEIDKMEVSQSKRFKIVR